MKFANAEFVIDNKYAAVLRERREIFRLHTGTKKSVFLAFITPHGVKENSFKGEFVQSEVTLDALFAE